MALETSGAGAVQGEAAAVTVRIFCCHTCPCWAEGQQLITPYAVTADDFLARLMGLSGPVPPWGRASHPSYAENCKEKRAAKLIDRSSAGGRERQAQGDCFCVFASGQAVNTSRKTNREQSECAYVKLAHNCNVLRLPSR